MSIKLHIFVELKGSIYSLRTLVDIIARNHVQIDMSMKLSKSTKKIPNHLKKLENR